MPSLDSFRCCKPLKVGSRTYAFYSLPAAEKNGLKGISRLPFTMKVLLENLLRHEDGRSIAKEDIQAVAQWLKTRTSEREIAFRPARVLMQDFTGVPAVVDLAAMRDAMKALRGDPKLINPLVPVDLVCDHSVAVNFFGNNAALKKNIEEEYRQNRERYEFLKWSQKSFDNFRVVPPGTGICHQVNLEYLSQTVFTGRDKVKVDGKAAVMDLAYPDTVLGMDSHTTMVNGLAVLGWGVGGIEAEAAMLGQPTFLPQPVVVGVRVAGALPPGTTATDLVLTLTEMLREHGVVGKFVEFFGDGLSTLTVADRATLSNMCPEYGATAAYFPVDGETLRYLAFTGRGDVVDLVERYTKEQGLFRTDGDPDPRFTEVLELDLGAVEPSVAGPKRPQDRVPLVEVWDSFVAAFRDRLEPNPRPTDLGRFEGEGGSPNDVLDTDDTAISPGEETPMPVDGELVRHGSVVIAAITSCTNTSNPSVMLAAGLLAKKAVEAGLETKPWVKTSLAPGSRVVTEYLDRSGLTPYLEKLGFALVGYGCTTCIGNSGPLPEKVAAAVEEGDLNVVAVLSGNRNFEGRIHPQVRASYLASPPLCVAYALAGSVDVDLTRQPLGDGADAPVFLRDLWPTSAEIAAATEDALAEDQFVREYAQIWDGDERWRALPTPSGAVYDWDSASTYVQEPPFFAGDRARAIEDVVGARVLVRVGDSITTDHISPAGSIKADSPAGRYLQERGVPPAEFNSYGARRGNHEVMMRGTFANIRLRNDLAPGTEGSWTTHLPSGDVLSVFDAAERYRSEGVPLAILAGKEYGSGSSRDWAAKGPDLLGVRFVIAESYERIHRANLVGMGILPLQYAEGDTAATLGLTGAETFAVRDLGGGIVPGQAVTVEATDDAGAVRPFPAVLRVDGEAEVEYLRAGGVLNAVLADMLVG